MSIGDLINHLRDSNIGKIYWHNICVQFRANLLDEKIARQVFQGASVNSAYRKAVKDNASKKATHDLSVIARQALYFSSTDNTNALLASRFGPPSKRELPKTVSTVISDETFESFCIKSTPSLRRALIQALAKSGVSSVPFRSDLRTVFSDMRSRKITRLNDLPGAARNILPHIVIRTRYSRFWMGGDPANLPSDPDSIRDLFGLGYLKKGNWLIRISMPTSALESALGREKFKLIRRPSAFCVNDDMAPRFRGITVEDHKESKNPPCRYGMTVKLDKVENNQIPDDGEREWICPEVVVPSGNVVFDLLGEIQNDRPKPDNADYAKYLQTALPLTPAEEQEVIEALSQPF